jgi:hypothetical protein
MFQEMPKRGEKLDVIVTIKMTEGDKRNLDTDIPILNKKLGRLPGDELDVSKFMRGAIHHLHDCLSKGLVPDWLATPEPKLIKPVKKRKV